MLDWIKKINERKLLKYKASARLKGLRKLLHANTNQKKVAVPILISDTCHFLWKKSDTEVGFKNSEGRAKSFGAQFPVGEVSLN